MNKTDKAYIAGFLEAKRARPRLSETGNGNYIWRLTLSCSASNPIPAIIKTARLLDLSILTSHSNTGLAENFSYANRSAVFNDRERISLSIHIDHSKLRSLISHIKPYLEKSTFAEFNKIYKRPKP